MPSRAEKILSLALNNVNNIETNNQIHSNEEIDFEIALKNDILFFDVGNFEEVDSVALIDKNAETIVEECVQYEDNIPMEIDTINLETSTYFADLSNVAEENSHALEEINNNKDLSIDSDSVVQSNVETSTGSSEHSFERKKKNTSRRKLTKIQKTKGLPHKSYTGKDIPLKEMKINPCLNKRCQNKCTSFSEEDRKKIFEFYYGLTDQNEQKQFLKECIKSVPVKRRRACNDNLKKKCTNECYLFKGNDKIQTKVCQQFLLNTLSISQRLLRTVIESKNLDKFPLLDKRGQHRPYNKMTQEQDNALDKFVKELPAVPSHYCRSSSTKKYLPSDIKSYNNLFRMYTTKMKELKIVPLKRSKFLSIFKDKYNIGIHVPRKDKCNKCEYFKNIPQEQKTEEINKKHNDHLQEKETVKQIFLQEQKDCEHNSETIVASFDLQKVLTTPHTDNMLVGYARKYAVYNFTVYETRTRRGICYLWEEKNGKRGSNEICSNLYHYLKLIDNEGEVLKVSFYCDNCAGQNKNKQLLAMIYYFLKNAIHIKEISITYLLSGHTYMPVDSMHAIIEKSLKHKCVWGPSEWPTILVNARLKPKPYEVFIRKYTEFQDWKAATKHFKLKSSSEKDVKIAQLKRIILQKQDDTFLYSTNYGTENNEGKIINKFCDLKSAYRSDIPINKKKYEDLKKLCVNNVIPQRYHVEYLSLKFGTTVPDELIETDIEDDSDNTVM